MHSFPAAPRRKRLGRPGNGLARYEGYGTRPPRHSHLGPDAPQVLQREGGLLREAGRPRRGGVGACAEDVHRGRYERDLPRHEDESRCAGGVGLACDRLRVGPDVGGRPVGARLHVQALSGGGRGTGDGGHGGEHDVYAWGEGGAAGEGGARGGVGVPEEGGVVGVEGGEGGHGAEEDGGAEEGGGAEVVGGEEGAEVLKDVGDLGGEWGGGRGGEIGDEEEGGGDGCQGREGPRLWWLCAALFHGYWWCGVGITCSRFGVIPVYRPEFFHQGFELRIP